MSRARRSLRTRKLLAVALLFALVAACSDSDGGDGDAVEPATGATDTTVGGDPTAAEELDVKVSTLGICNELTLTWAHEKGFFDQQNLNVELVPAAGGSAGVAGLVSGAIDVTFTNGFTALLGVAQGFPLRIVSNAYNSGQLPEPPSNGMWVRSDSEIEGPLDLEGRTVAVNELGGINEIATSAWVRAEGGDPGQIKYVAIPFGQMMAALLDGTVDAAESSTVTAARVPKGEIRSLADPYQGIDRVLFAGYWVLDDFLKENPDAGERFFDAMQAALADWTALEDKTELYQVMSKACGQEPDTIANSPSQDQQVVVDPAVLEYMGTLLIEDGQLKEVPDVESMVPEFVRP